MPSVLVTGATGYVGQEVVRQLLAAGYAVTALGRTHPPQDVSFVQADLTDADALAAALAGHAFAGPAWAGIIHLASLPGDTGDPHEMVRVNVVGCHNLLAWARRAGVGRFVLTSSISAYEWYPATKFHPPDHMPVREDHPCRPQDMYSVTKRVQEELALTYFHQYGLPVTALRLTAVVGPRGQGGGRGWRAIAGQLAGGERVQVPHFSADELCHYVDIRDAARMHLVALEHPGAVGEIFNCCGPQPTRGREFAEILPRLFPGIRVEYGFPWSMAQGGEIAFDMGKARRLLGFMPQHTIADSLQSIKEWIDAGGLTADAGERRAFGGGVQKG